MIRKLGSKSVKATRYSKDKMYSLSYFRAYSNLNITHCPIDSCSMKSLSTQTLSLIKIKVKYPSKLDGV
jgi:hypothetical protein